jgi:hypothetical protein
MLAGMPAAPRPIRPALRGVLFCCLLSGGGALQAAGGHHAVDDAELVEEGRCEFESWFQRESGAGRLLHLGADCRVGPVELGASTEPQRARGESTADHAIGIKWAREIASGLSIGLAASPEWQAHARPRFQGTVARTLLTWSAGENVRLHANVGRDFVHRGSDEPRHGAAIDWRPGGGAWELAAERYREEGGHFARAGVRWTPGKDWRLDLSRAVRLRGDGESSWTLGLQREFDR